VLVALRQTWGEDRVFFLDDGTALKSLPRAWTDLAEPDVFVAVAVDRCPFRLDDLLTLAELIEGLRPPLDGDSHV